MVTLNQNKIMKSIAVFCASSEGIDPIYVKKAYELGKFLAKNEIQLVYGGAGIGCMGALAKGSMENGGRVIGVLPHFLNKREVAAADITELIMVESMHERKLKMHELSDGVITLPGGFGTMEELFEMLTWGQLGLHQKTMGILNVNSYYTHLMKQLILMEKEQLLQKRFLKMLIMRETIPELIDSMKAYKAPASIELLNKKRS